MTDRIKGFVVVLDNDYRTDDVEEIRNALLMVKGVLSVSPSVAGIDDHMNRERVRLELMDKLFALMKDPYSKK